MSATASSLKYTAICFSLSFCALAQWHEDAWRVTGNQLARTRYALQTNVWCAPQSFPLTNAVFAYTTNIVTGAATNSIPYYTNNISTQSFLVAIGPDTNDIDDASAPVFSWPLAYATNQLTTNVALVPFVYLATGECARVSSNLWLDAAGVRDLDVYGALQERYAVAGFDDPDPPRFYRSHYQNVVSAKAAVSNIAPYYVNNLVASAGTFNDYFSAANTNGDFWTNGIAQVFPQYTNAEELAIGIRAPTNYFAVTLVRSVDMEGGTRTYYLVTSTNYITISGSNATQQLTQDVFKTWGEPWRMIGTNGQRFTSTSTNADMERLFTTADYGQWRLRVALTNMQATQTGEKQSDAQIFTRYYQGIDAYNKPDWMELWSASQISAEAEYATNTYYFGAATNFTYAVMYINSTGQRYDLGDGNSRNFATLYSSRLLLAVTNGNTNISFRADFYIWPSNFMRDEGTGSNMTYDANGLITGQVPQILSDLTAHGSNGYAEAAVWFGPSDPLTATVPVWVDEPPTDGLVYERGFYGQFRAVLWWDFKYR